MSIIASVYGRAGRDGELRTSHLGKSWCRLSVVAEVGKDRDGQPIDEWVTLVAFGAKAEDLARVQKGGMVAAIGRMELSRWTDREGNDRESWSLIADEILSVRSARPGGRAKGEGKVQAQAAQRASYEAQKPSDGAPFDDDLQF